MQESENFSSKQPKKILTLSSMGNFTDAFSLGRPPPPLHTIVDIHIESGIKRFLYIHITHRLPLISKYLMISKNYFIWGLLKDFFSLKQKLFFY